MASCSPASRPRRFPSPRSTSSFKLKKKLEVEKNKTHETETVAMCVQAFDKRRSNVQALGLISFCADRQTKQRSNFNFSLVERLEKL